MAVEQVNQDILKILGLEETDEIGMKSYKGFLREKLVEISMGKGGLSRDEELIIQSEFQRVKKKPDTVKVKKKKITAQNIGFKRPSSSLVKYKTITAFSKEIAPQSQQETIFDSSIGKNLKNINDTLNKILKSLVSQGESDKKRREKERTDSEKRKAQERESGLEKPLQVAKTLVKKIIAPFQGILDRVFRFLGFTFLGWLIGKYEEIQQWVTANKDKVDVVKRFLKDWWPSLLFAAGLFLTPFGAFVRGTIMMIRSFIPRILGLLNLIKANPLVAGLTLATIGGAAKIKESERMRPDVEKIQAETDKTLKNKDAPWYEKLGASLANQSLNAPTGPKNPTGLPTPGAVFAKGGKIPLFGFSGGAGIGDYFSGYVDKDSGLSVKGFGQDTQAFPIEGGGTGILKPGEVVMNTGAVNAIGADKLLAWNKQFGGSNANKPVNFTYNGGGVIGMRGSSVDKYSRGTSMFGEVPLIRAALSAGIKGQELVAFLSQMSHETGQFKWNRELSRGYDKHGRSLGYSGGPKYHGRGYTQLTHDYNYREFGKKYGVDLLTDPDLLVRDPNLSAKIAIDYWKERVRPRVKNWNDVFSHSAAVNLPSATSSSEIEGYDDRVSKFNYYNQNLNRIVSRSVPPTRKQKPQAKPSFVKNIAGFVGGLFGRGAIAKPQKRQGGGRVTTTTGFDIKGGLMGADTQLLPPIAVQPGEELYVVPKQAVPYMDNAVAQVDRNSKAAQNQSKVGALRTGLPSVKFISLPPITTPISSNKSNAGVTPGKPQIPDFDVEMESSRRMEVAQELGIIDLV